MKTSANQVLQTRDNNEADIYAWQKEVDKLQHRLSKATVKNERQASKVQGLEAESRTYKATETHSHDLRVKIKSTKKALKISQAEKAGLKEELATEKVALEEVHCPLEKAL